MASMTYILLALYVLAFLYPLGTLQGRFINLVFSLDCFLFSVCTQGTSYPGESFSSAAYRAEKYGMFYGKARPLIDWLFSWLGQREHCKYAYDMAKLNLPEDQR